MFYTIKTIEPNATNYNIKIAYSDTLTIMADFKELLEKGVMTVLKNPVIFNQVQIGNKGRSIIWQGNSQKITATNLHQIPLKLMYAIDLILPNKTKDHDQFIETTHSYD